jgi:predicted alpha/beta hydrolase
MMRAYLNVTRRHIRPADYGLQRLQHMGFFREGAEPLWQEVIEWLSAPFRKYGDVWASRRPPGKA